MLLCEQPQQPPFVAAEGLEPSSGQLEERAGSLAPLPAPGVAPLDPSRVAAKQREISDIGVPACRGGMSLLLEDFSKPILPSCCASVSWPRWLPLRICLACLRRRLGKPGSEVELESCRVNPVFWRAPGFLQPVDLNLLRRASFSRAKRQAFWLFLRLDTRC